MIINDIMAPLVRQKIQNDQYFAIGYSPTHNVKKRTSRYNPLKDGWIEGYNKLYESNNPLSILALEDDAIQHFRTSDFLTNKIVGGCGSVKHDHASWILYLKIAY